MDQGGHGRLKVSHSGNGIHVSVGWKECSHILERCIRGITFRIIGMIMISLQTAPTSHSRIKETLAFACANGGKRGDTRTWNMEQTELSSNLSSST